jgi:hypothetical protein
LISHAIIDDINRPTPQFTKKERGTLDYIENDRDPNEVKKWSESALHSGPGFIQEQKKKVLQEADQKKN